MTQQRIDPVIFYSTIESLDTDLDPKSGSQAGSGSGIWIQKKRIFDKLTEISVRQWASQALSKSQLALRGCLWPH